MRLRRSWSNAGERVGLMWPVAGVGQNEVGWLGSFFYCMRFVVGVVAGVGVGSVGAIYGVCNFSPPLCLTPLPPSTPTLHPLS